MFLGHYGVAFAAKRVAPRMSLGTLFFAAQWADLLWPLLLLAGVERVRIAPGLMAANSLDFTHYPVSHSLVALAVWGALFGLVSWRFRRDATGAWVLAAVVVSHWVLDLIVHQPDLPIFPGGPRLGLGLWNSVPATLIAEGLTLGLGLLVYLRSTTARDRVGRVSLWALVVLLILIYVSNLWAPPPSNVQQLAMFALAGWLVVPWGYWIDRHRSAKTVQR